MCRCHSHAAPTPPDKEPKVEIGIIESDHTILR
jgi:hypothetical protein